MLKKKYNTKCDVWTIGCLLFILLSSDAPFNGTDSTLKKKIPKGKLSIGDYEMNDFNEVSDEAKDLVWKMLAVDKNERISCEEALRHQWF